MILMHVGFDKARTVNREKTEKTEKTEDMN